jgi:hypothetical protein
LTIPEYEIRSYEELSNEFKEKTSRAIELIRLMYDRLTLVDHMSHKQVIRKIIEDHSRIRGFSFRNISRNLPLNNPVTPRRVRTSWHNSIPTNNSSAGKLSQTEQVNKLDRHQSHNDNEEEDPSLNCNQNAQSIEVIPGRTSMVTTNKISKGLTFRIPREKYEMLRLAMDESNEVIRVIFDWSFEFDHAEPDVVKSKM